MKKWMLDEILRQIHLLLNKLSEVSTLHDHVQYLQKYKFNFYSWLKIIKQPKQLKT